MPNLQFHKRCSKIYVLRVWTIEQAVDRVEGKIRRFIEDGHVSCSNCGLKATHVVRYYQAGQEKSLKRNNLFGLGPDGAVLMTVDHILPDALGGSGGIKNLRPMCALCNVDRASKLQPNELVNILMNVNDHVSSMGHGRKRFFNFIKKKHQPMRTWARLLIQHPQLGQQVRFI